MVWSTWLTNTLRPGQRSFYSEWVNRWTQWAMASTDSWWSTGGRLWWVIHFAVHLVLMGKSRNYKCAIENYSNLFHVLQAASIHGGRGWNDILGTIHWVVEIRGMELLWQNYWYHKLSATPWVDPILKIFCWLHTLMACYGYNLIVISSEHALPNMSRSYVETGNSW